MKANDFVRKIKHTDEAFLIRTIDRIFFGDAEKEVSKVATCMVVTPNVLKDAIAWGADLLVTHEPTFLEDPEQLRDAGSYAVKRELLENADLAVCRWHDTPHWGAVDYVSAALIRRMDWKGTFDGKFFFEFDEPITPLQIAKDIRDRMNIKQPRIVGKRDGEVKKITIQLGSRGVDPYIAMLENDVDLAICGETSEKLACEPIRDMAQLGMQKTIIILGHCASERDVMCDLANYINRTFVEDKIEAQYFDSGELYGYIDN